MPNDPLALLDQITAGGAKGRPQSVTVGVARSLTEQDLERLAANPQVPKPPALAQLRHTHHLLAQNLAKGMKAIDAAAATGYSPERVYVLSNDPAFAELIEHYRHQRELAFVDALERMKQLGIMAVEELHKRLEEGPDGFTKAELMTLSETMLVKGRQVGAGAAAPVLPIINVNFGGAGPKTIDGTAE